MKQMFYSLSQLTSAGLVILPVVILVDQRLSPGALHTWLLLKSLAGSASATPPFSRAYFCKLAGINRSTLYSHLQKLSSLGYLTAHKVTRTELVVSFPAELLELQMAEKNDIAASLKDSVNNHKSENESILRGNDVQKNGQSTISRNPVDLYRELTHLTPNRTQRQQIDAHATDLDA